MSTYELCERKPDKIKIWKIQVKKSFVLHEDVIDTFHNNLYIPTIEKSSFHLACVKNIGWMKRGKTKCDSFQDRIEDKLKLKKDYAKTFSEKIGI